MRRKMPVTVAFCLMAGLLPGTPSVSVMAAEEPAVTEVSAAQTDASAETVMESNGSESGNDLAGQTVFAQCEEYVNIRENASIDSEVTAKIYNNGSATVEEQDGEWYRIRSGNAIGYAKAEYFATGEAAAAIAEQVAYNVAVVHPEELNVRSNPDAESDVITSAREKDELEVVAWDGDWMKVALGGDVYGYVNAYYVDYKTYYPTAETIEEEQTRLLAEQAAAESADYSQEWEADGSGEFVPEEETIPETEPVYTEESAPETEPEYTEETVPETEPEYTEETVPETEPEYTEETVPETEPEYTEETVPETEPVYEETAPETEPVYTEAPETEPISTEAPETEPVYTEAPETEPEYTEAPETEPISTEAPETEPAGSSSGSGQQIADFAVQYVGNPYVWGGTSLTDGADCSGFVQTVFANFGIGLARTAESQAYGGTSVSLSDLQPGDLLFYNSTGSIDHVALYIGGGQIVHAANSRSGIIISSAYYQTPVSAARYW